MSKNTTRKIISISISLLLIFVMLSCPAMVKADKFGDSNSQDYFAFNTSDANMLPDGSFTFYMRHYIQSGYFTANSSKVTIYTCANIYNENTSSSYTDSNVSFTLRLYADGSLVGSYIGYANGIYGGLDFNVSQYAGCWFTITVNNTLPNGCYLNGYGKAYNVIID